MRSLILPIHHRHSGLTSSANGTCAVHGFSAHAKTGNFIIIIVIIIDLEWPWKYKPWPNHRYHHACRGEVTILQHCFWSYQPPTLR